MDEDGVGSSFRDIEVKVGRKVPESLVRSMTEAAQRSRTDHRSPAPVCSELRMLESKLNHLKQEMAHLRAIDVKLMHQLLSINEGIESIRWVMEERGGIPSRESSLNGSLYSLSDSQDASHHGSLGSLTDRHNDELDGISVGSYLDTLGEDFGDHSSLTDLSSSFNEKTIIEDDNFSKSPLQPRVESDEYYCFG